MGINRNYGATEKKRKNKKRNETGVTTLCVCVDVDMQIWKKKKSEKKNFLLFTYPLRFSLFVSITLLWIIFHKPGKISVSDVIRNPRRCRDAWNVLEFFWFLFIFFFPPMDHPISWGMYIRMEKSRTRFRQFSSEKWKSFFYLFNFFIIIFPYYFQNFSFFFCSSLSLFITSVDRARTFTLWSVHVP